MVFSEAELKLFKSLGYEKQILVNLYDNPLTYYNLAMIHCFMDNRQGDNADALRRAIKAINDSNPYRMTDEFDKLISF